MKKIIASPLAPKAVGPYSQAVENNGTLYISGQLPIDAATGILFQEEKPYPAQETGGAQTAHRRDGHGLRKLHRYEGLIHARSFQPRSQIFNYARKTDGQEPR